MGDKPVRFLSSLSPKRGCGPERVKTPAFGGGDDLPTLFGNPAKVKDARYDRER